MRATAVKLVFSKQAVESTINLLNVGSTQLFFRYAFSGYIFVKRSLLLGEGLLFFEAWKASAKILTAYNKNVDTKRFGRA